MSLTSSVLAGAVFWPTVFLSPNFDESEKKYWQCDSGSLQSVIPGSLLQANLAEPTFQVYLLLILLQLVSLLFQSLFKTKWVNAWTYICHETTNAYHCYKTVAHLPKKYLDHVYFSPLKLTDCQLTIITESQSTVNQHRVGQTSPDSRWDFAKIL